MTLSIISPPAVEPVDLASAKIFLRVDHDHEDAMILQMLSAAREQVETMTGQVLISQRMVRAFCGAAPRCLRITPGPVQIVHEVRALSIDNTPSTVATWAYTVNRRCVPAALNLADTAYWSSFTDDLDAIEIEFTSGFGDSADAVPAPFKQAILLLTAQSYERGAQPHDLPVPMMVDALLMPYRGARL